MRITGLMRRLSSIGIDAIWELSLGCLLMRTIERFLRYTAYLNFINGPTSGLTAIKTTSLNIAQQFMKEMVKVFWSIKIQVKFLIN